MKILVTGSQGFIGSNIVTRLLDLGYKVIGIDKINKIDSAEKWSQEHNKIINSNLKNKNFKFIHWNLLNEHKFYDPEQEKLYDILNEKIDIVIHCAAIVGVTNHIKDTGLFLKNLELDQRIIRWCDKSHLIYLSSSEVYGDSKEAMGDSSDLRISSELRSNYALEKLFAERIIQSKLKNWTIVRPFNVTGPTQNPENGVLPGFIHKAKHNKDINVYRKTIDGLNPKRTFLHIWDFVNAIEHIILNLKKYNQEIVNIGSQNSYDIYVLAELIVNKLKSKSKVYRAVCNKNDNVILNRYPYYPIFNDIQNYKVKDLQEIIEDIVSIY